jgi:pSer/pThr/pTyr-binding forkhead associated (FHA) protein
MDIGLVCDSCSTFNPMGATVCARCGEALSLDLSARDAPPASAVGARAPGAGPRPPATAQRASAGRVCPACSAPVVEGHKFCGACGTRLPQEGPEADAAARADAMTPDATRPRAGAAASGKRTMFFGAMQETRAKLVLIKGDGLDGVSFTLAGQEHTAGREDAALEFDEDPFLSPIHANFFYRAGKLLVRDENSLNGVYIRIRGAREMRVGDHFLVGEQLLEVQSTLGGDDPIEPTSDGTYFFASPRRTSHFRVVQELRGGDTGLAYRARSDVVSLGREGNDIDFPDDPFISGHHAQVSYTDGKLMLHDLDSKNGTFLRITGEQQLSHGDYVFMGQQLLRVEIV